MRRCRCGRFSSGGVCRFCWDRRVRSLRDAIHEATIRWFLNDRRLWGGW